MKHGNFWMTTIGAGVVIAGMMTAGRAAMKSPAFLFLAGQMKVAAGQTDEGMRLMNEAAAQRETGTVHAAEPAAKPTQVCTNSKSGSASLARPETVRTVKTAAAKKAVPTVLVAKLEFPMPPVTPNADAFRPVNFDPSTVPYLNDEQRARIIQAQIEMQKAQREKMNQIRRTTHAVLVRYAPPSAGFSPADISNIERDLPVSLGQLAQ